MKYRIDNNTIWEDTGKVIFHNYPPDHKGTLSYATKVYREIKRDSLGWKEVEGPPIYEHNMSILNITLFRIAAMASNTLFYSLETHKEILDKLIKDKKDELL